METNQKINFISLTLLSFFKNILTSGGDNISKMLALGASTFIFSKTITLKFSLQFQTNMVTIRKKFIG